MITRRSTDVGAISAAALMEAPAAFIILYIIVQGRKFRIQDYPHATQNVTAPSGGLHPRPRRPHATAHPG